MFELPFFIVLWLQQISHMQIFLKELQPNFEKLQLKRLLRYCFGIFSQAN